MTTFAFIHGAGDVGWYWHLVEAELRSSGHQTTAPDLPTEDDSAGLSRYADVVVVAQSFGGYVAPIVAERIGAAMIVMVAGMVPTPGESAEAMFEATGWHSEPGHAGTREVFYHDVPDDLAAEAMARGRRQSDTPGREPWPLDAWPDVATRFIVCREDRFFPRAWLRKVVHDRLGITPDEIDSGHCPALSRSRDLAAMLEGYVDSQRRGR